MQRPVAKNDFNGKSKSLGSGLDKNARPSVVSSKSALGIEKGSAPIFLLSEWIWEWIDIYFADVYFLTIINNIMN